VRLAAGVRPSKVDFYKDAYGEDSDTDEDTSASGAANESSASKTEKDGKHWFQLDKSALPIFTALHNHFEVRFTDLLLHEKQHALCH